MGIKIRNDEVIASMENMAVMIHKTYWGMSQVVLDFDIDCADELETPVLQPQKENGEDVLWKCRPFADTFMVSTTLDDVEIRIYAEDMTPSGSDCVGLKGSVCVLVGDNPWIWIQSFKYNISVGACGDLIVKKRFLDILEVLKDEGRDICDNADAIKKLLKRCQSMPCASLVMCLIENVNYRIKHKIIIEGPDIEVSKNQNIHVKCLGDGIILACEDKEKLDMICN